MSPPTTPLRIIHLPIDIGRNVAGLAAAQRALGHDATCISLQWSALGFNGDISFEPEPSAPNRLMAREIGRFRLLWRTLTAADVVHCHFGRTALSVRSFPLRDPAAEGPGEQLRLAYARLFWMKDLPLWRALGKTIAMTFYGDDIRQTSLARARNPFSHLHLPEVAAPLAGREPLQRRLSALMERYADVIYATNPDLLECLPARARLLPYSNMAPAAPPPWPGDGPLKLLHMPTNRSVKGSDLIAAAAIRLKGAGVAVELTEVENVANEKALAAIDAHHMLVDQLRVGWYGGVAVEAMARARPVVAYLHPGDLKLAPAGLAQSLPIINANPESIFDVLRAQALTPKTELRALGQRSWAFATCWHNPAKIAADVIADYRKGLG